MSNLKHTVSVLALGAASLFSTAAMAGTSGDTYYPENSGHGHQPDKAAPVLKSTNKADARAAAAALALAKQKQTTVVDTSVRSKNTLNGTVKGTIQGGNNAARATGGAASIKDVQGGAASVTGVAGGSVSGLQTGTQNTTIGGDTNITKIPVQPVAAPDVNIQVSGDCPAANTNSFALWVVSGGAGSSGVDKDCLKQRLDAAKEMQNDRELFSIVHLMIQSENKLVLTQGLGILREMSTSANKAHSAFATNILQCQRKLLDSDALIILGSQPELDCNKIPALPVKTDAGASFAAAAASAPVAPVAPAPVPKPAATTVRKNYTAAAAPAPIVNNIYLNGVSCGPTCVPQCVVTAASAPSCKH